MNSKNILPLLLTADLLSVEETKSIESISAKIHGFGSVIGFLLLTFAPLLADFLHYL